MTKSDFSRLCAENFAANGIEQFATDEILSKLCDLCEIFLETNKAMNLTAIKDEKLVISRHFADCLIPASFFPLRTNVLDVGSGGGMPALPLAIARPDLNITALDATAKKTVYIENTARALGLSNVSVITGRAEELARTELRASFDVVTARAVAQTNVLAELCVPFVKKGGLFIALKGKREDDSADAAASATKKLGCRLASDNTFSLVDPDGEISERHVLVYEKKADTPKNFPRKYAQILKNPL